MTVRSRIVLGLILPLLLVGAPFTTGQEAGRKLILKKRSIDLRIHENLALARITLVLENPDHRPAEALISLNAPVGGAVGEVALLKNIASAERRSKLMSPEWAEKLYVAVKGRALSDDQMSALEGVMSGTGFSLPGRRMVLPAALESLPGVSTISIQRVRQSGGRREPVASSNGGGASAPAAESVPSAGSGDSTASGGAPATAGDGTASGEAAPAPSVESSAGNQAPQTSPEPTTQQDNPTQQTPQADTPWNPQEPPPSIPFSDPAVCSWIGGDQYRLKAFPILPFDDQTISIVYAWEIRCDDRGYSLELPMPVMLDTTFDRAETDEVTVKFQSAGAVQVVESTPALRVLDAAKGRILAAGGGDPRSSRLTLRYRLEAGASRFDFGREVDWKAMDRDLSFGAAFAERAVLARRAIASLLEKNTSEAAVRIQQLSRIAGIASREASLIVIERQVAQDEAGRMKDPARPVSVKLTEEAIATCDVLREKMGLKPLRKAASCCEHTVTTNDPKQVQWAKDKGLKLWEPYQNVGYSSYVYVKHAGGCPMAAEVDPKGLESLVK